jgi:Pvc16 N-terminal domain
VIHEIDEALRGLVHDDVVDGSDIDVAFDAPTREWSGRRNAPTINLYLYDIREDLGKRTRGLVNDYDDRQVVGRHLPPRYFRLSYLVTAWTQRPEDEHRLLSLLLDSFLRHEALPAERLHGRVGALGIPVEVSIALPPPADRSFADVWSALGGELKPSLDVVLSVPVEPAKKIEIAMPAFDGPILTLSGKEDGQVDRLRRKHVPVQPRQPAESATPAATGSSDSAPTARRRRRKAP